MAHTHAQKHTLYKHRKVLTPNSNLELQAITGLTVTKPKIRKKRSRSRVFGMVGVWLQWRWRGWAVNSALNLFCCFETWLRLQNVFHDAGDNFHSVCWDLHKGITQKRTKTPSHQMPPKFKHNFNGIIFKKYPWLFRRILTLLCSCQQEYMESRRRIWGGVNHTMYTDCEALI